MSDDRAALRELFQSSPPGAMHALVHYLYFRERDQARLVSKVLVAQGFEVEARLGADGVNWLVLARHNVVPTEELIDTTRAVMERIASNNAGEYDGWEAEL